MKIKWSTVIVRPINTITIVEDRRTLWKIKRTSVVEIWHAIIIMAVREHR